MEIEFSSLQLDTDILEPYKIRIEVKVIGSERALNECTLMLNETYKIMKNDDKIILPRFYNRNIQPRDPLYEWFRKIQGVITIYDFSQQDTVSTEEDIYDKYKALMQKSTNDGINRLMIFADKPIEINKLDKEKEGISGKSVIIDKKTSLKEKVILMEPLLLELFKSINEHLSEDYKSFFNATNTPWHLTEELGMDLTKERKGRLDKCILDLRLMGQAHEEVLKNSENVRAECKKQKDHIWIASIDSMKAASILKKRLVASELLLTSPYEDDEAVRLILKSGRRYGKHGRPDYELETAFKLLNTYKNINSHGEMFEELRRISEEIMPKWTKPEHLAGIYLAMAKTCEDAGAGRKSAYYVYMASKAAKLSHSSEAKLGYLLEILETFGISRDPQHLIIKNYEEAQNAIKILEERTYKFSYKNKENGIETLATKRLPAKCVVSLRNKHPLIKFALEEPPWPKLQLQILKEIISCAKAQKMSVPK